MADKGEGKDFVLLHLNQLQTLGGDFAMVASESNHDSTILRELALAALYLLLQESLPGGTIPCPCTAQKEPWERKEFDRLTPEASQSEARAELAMKALLAVC